MTVTMVGMAATAVALLAAFDSLTEGIRNWHASGNPAKLRTPLATLGAARRVTDEPVRLVTYRSRESLCCFTIQDGCGANRRSGDRAAAGPVACRPDWRRSELSASATPLTPAGASAAAGANQVGLVLSGEKA